MLSHIISCISLFWLLYVKKEFSFFLNSFYLFNILSVFLKFNLAILFNMSLP